MEPFREGDHVMHPASGAELVFLRELDELDEFITPVLCATQDIYGARVGVERTDLEACNNRGRASFQP